MPVNRNALVRYKTIDQCLQNRMRTWTLDDLVDACSEALYEYEGIDKGVSKRTVQADIQMMRSEKLGYNAPIIVIDKKFYTYEDPDYSITNIPLTSRDLNKLNEVVEILKQFKGFSHFRELTGMVQRLEDKIYRSSTLENPIIDFEKNENLKGLEYIDQLYQAILQKTALKVTYQSFKALEAQTFTFHPYLLKEYRNRWFVLGIRDRDSPVYNLALDRILGLEKSEAPYLQNKVMDTVNYFKNVIGVTVSQNLEPKEVILYINQSNAPYVLTKPFHHSQKVLEHNEFGLIVSIKVQLNFELEREILGFGEGIQVLKPEKLQKRIRYRLKKAHHNYEVHAQEAPESTIKAQFLEKNSVILPALFPVHLVFAIKSKIQTYLDQHPQEEAYGIRQLLWKIPGLIPLLFQENLIRLIHQIDPKAFLVKSIFFNKTEDINWYVPWHQDLPIHVKEKIATPGYHGWTKKGEVLSVCPPKHIYDTAFTLRIHLDHTTPQHGALRVIPGMDRRIYTNQEIQQIIRTHQEETCPVQRGGIHLTHPLTLHASSKSEVSGGRGVLHLEFNSQELDRDLVWAEKLRF